ncbi:hypothetical protein JTE90_010952 [Oedothorax gibbosus]|uniref:Complement component C3 n=1 Tax=Oedothorax gibbosus TaxID=931172 RepID=A0AAV6UAX7_9ARAC|nr:hypothetical protein JTE90_010952 [Oedothorax gibbosus]
MLLLKCIGIIWISILSTSYAQVFHVIAPNTLRLNSEETIGIASEDNTVVSAYIQDYPGKIKNITQTTFQLTAGQPELFKVHLNPSDFPPNFLTGPNPEKFVTLIVHSDKFHKEVRIPVSNQAGYVFIQTDKPIYTPKQMANIRIIPLDEEGLPSDKPFKLQIKNPKNIIAYEKIFNQDSMKFRKPFVTHLYKFPNYPILGEWSATVNYGYEMQQNSTVHFEVQEYELPTFTVELKTPDVILQSHESIDISVKAKYVYGKNVQGMVTFRVGVKGELPNVTFFAVYGPFELVRGEYKAKVSTKSFQHHKDIGWFPGIEGSHLVVEASVVDDASGNKEVVKDAKGRFSKSPFQISFKRCLQDFKPGLVSIFEADINYIDGKPASGIATKITATANGNALHIARPTAVSDADGKVSFKLHPEMQHTVLSITIETTDPRYDGFQVAGHFLQNRFESKNRAYIALERSSSHKLKIGDTFSKAVYMEPDAMKDIYYAVISRGKIIKINKLRQGAFKIQRVEFQLSYDMVPSFRLVVWAHYKDELIADSLNIDIEDACHPKAEVKIDPDYPAKEPGNVGSVNIRGTKNTYVGLLGVDQAVYALSKKDLLTKAKIFRSLAKHDLGCGPGGGITTDAVMGKAGIIIATNIYTPPIDGSSSCTAIKRRKRAAVNEILNPYTGLERECCALGVALDAQNRDCQTRTNIVTKYLQGLHLNCSKAFLQCCLEAVAKGNPGLKLRANALQMARMGGKVDDLLEVSIAEEEEYEKSVTVRSDFRETWIFEDFFIGPDGVEKKEHSLPHSITTWVISAVSVSPQYGICVAEPQSIVSMKKVFLQLNLPYSVVRNEQIEIQVTVFNYGQKKLRAIVYMYGVEDLCTGANEGEKSERKKLDVDGQSASSVAFPVIPLKVGTFDIKVVALSPEGSDVIMRPLNVIPEGYPFEFDIPIKLDPSNQQRRKKKHVTNDALSDLIDSERNMQTIAITLPVPENFVPETESCTITALGDQFGPTVETALTDPGKLLLKPRGCGEQNMMFLAPTLYTMRYLKSKGKISPEIEEQGYSFIRQGYGNQLSFRKDDGSYAAYQQTPTSIWLTAFVIKVFCQANELVHIDDHVMCSGIKYLMDHQQPDGSFIESRPVYHIDMMGGVQGQTPLTAFVLITLEECKCDQENLLISKKRALAYLENHLGDVNEPLAIAIMAYALSLSDSALKQAAHDRLISIAKFDEEQNRMHWGAGNSAQDIETTAYALLNMMLFNDMIRGNSIVNWLNAQQLQSGSFKSTQDTVVALQALSEYVIRAQMPSINLVANITSSNDRNFQKVLNFHEGNAHILQDVKVNKIGGMLFINTAGHGVGSLKVKMRYNLLHPPENLCKFIVTVNATEVKINRNALKAARRDPGKEPFVQFPPDLIRGIEKELNVVKDGPVLDIDPRNRGRSSRMPAGIAAARPRRMKRQAESENSKLTMKIAICTRYLGDKNAGMSIVDVGIFSGFSPNAEDLSELTNDPDHLIERYERSSKGVVFYLKMIPKSEEYCFQFRVVQEYIVGRTQSSVVKVYDYYNPDETCTVFYGPGSSSPILRTLCDGGICQCAEGGCPPQEPFKEIKDYPVEDQRLELNNIACERYDFVWFGQLSEEIQKINGFYNISFEIENVVKEGTEKKEFLEGEVRYFLARDNCDTAVLFPNQKYLIMGKDGQKYKNAEGVIWNRYLLDKTSAIHLWTTIRNAKDKDAKELQRYLNQLKRNGVTCM